MAVAFRHGDPRLPFFWEYAAQPAARWHADGEGPVQYLADTADGAWAEFLRHEEIVDPEDLAGVRRRIWAIELPDTIDQARVPDLPDHVLHGGPETYRRCRLEARRLRAAGAGAIRAPSAAVLPGGARGQLTRDDRLVDAADRDGVVWALFGTWENLRGWATADAGAPTARVLGLVRQFGAGRVKAPPPQR
jgi:hypothetical protein